MPAGRMSAPACAGTRTKGEKYDERVGDKGDGEGRRRRTKGRKGEGELKEERAGRH